MEKSSLCRDLAHNPRESEDSRIVASKWGDATDTYLSEIPDASNTQYFNLTAERLLYRNKLLSLPVDQGLVECDAIQSAHPFGKRGPDFAMLRDASVRLAMALVPLTPTGGNGRAVLARLYCVGDLSARYSPPFDEGVDLSGIDNYSWFVVGVPEVLNGERLSGRSWLLAASLLMEIIKKGDKASARNLAASFIVTGDVYNGRIKEVEMGRKPELARVKEYRNLKWIVPVKNTNDVVDCKTEKPETLQIAYRLIETLQNDATRSFFRFLKGLDIAGMKEQFRMGADIFAVDKTTRCMAYQIISREMIKTKGQMENAGCESRISHELQDRLDKLDEIRRWLVSLGADSPMTFFLLAKNRMNEAVVQLAEKYDINGQDSEGLTAVDIALNSGDFETARLLHRFGGCCDRLLEHNSVLRKFVRNFSFCPKMDAVEFGTPDSWKITPELREACNMSQNMSTLEKRIVLCALEVGLSPGVQVTVINRNLLCPSCRPTVPIEASTLEAFMGAHDPMLNGVSLKKVSIFPETFETSLFGAAVYHGNMQLIKSCLEHGADPNTGLLVANGDGPFAFEEFSDWSKPISVMFSNKNLCVWEKESLLQLLCSYGGVIGEKETIVLDDVRLLSAARRNWSKLGSLELQMNVLEPIERRKNYNSKAIVFLSAKDGDFGESTIFGKSVYEGCGKVVEKCLELGANPAQELVFTVYNDARSIIKGTPIEIARRNRNVEIEEILNMYIEKHNGVNIH